MQNLHIAQWKISRKHHGSLHRKKRNCMFLIDHTTCVCLIERLVGEEAIEQGQGSGGLVHGHHVAGLVHLQEGEAAAALLGGGSASHTTGHGGSVCIRCVVPSMVRLSIEGCVATPGQGLGPCLVTDPGLFNNEAWSEWY